MEIFVATALVIFGAARDRGRRNPADNLTDIRSATDTAILFILGAAAMRDSVPTATPPATVTSRPAFPPPISAAASVATPAACNPPIGISTPRTYPFCV
ncbi:MAG: hypothetical protein EXR43_06415 [Dehalococcoidia bacterium]|nr:hypothetical protein [Dehalococcoidia bacterium]